MAFLLFLGVFASFCRKNSNLYAPLRMYQSWVVPFILLHLIMSWVPGLSYMFFYMIGFPMTFVFWSCSLILDKFCFSLVSYRQYSLDSVCGVFHLVTLVRSSPWSLYIVGFHKVFVWC